jgi:hypothetical protein
MAHKTSKPVPLAAGTGSKRKNRWAAFSSPIAISLHREHQVRGLRARFPACVIAEPALGKAAITILLEVIQFCMARAQGWNAVAIQRDVDPNISGDCEKITVEIGGAP